tara:strand:- start:1536 stop:2120 length:585 start_codon:yes stop_codon:yes gene_type:complete
MKKIYIIMPVKYNSKRLKNKNILPIKNLPMFIYVAKKFQKKKLISKLIVSSESKKIKEICETYNVDFLKRPNRLSKPNVEKQEVVVDAVKRLKYINNNDIIISLQPNSPEVKFDDLKKALLFFKNKLYKDSEIKELICINKKNIQNPSFRILTYKAVFQKTLSTKIGVYFADYEDIHTKKEYLIIKKKIENKKN